MMRQRPLARMSPVVLLAFLALSSCVRPNLPDVLAPAGQAGPGTVAEAGVAAFIGIVAPAEGSQVQAGVFIDVHSMVVDPAAGVAAATLLVNGASERVDLLQEPLQRGDLYQPWTPQGCGPVVLQVQAATADGRALESPAVNVTVTCDVTPPSETPTATPTQPLEATPVEEPTQSEPEPTDQVAPEPTTAVPVPSATTPVPASAPAILAFDAAPPQINPGGNSRLTCQINGAVHADIGGLEVNPANCDGLIAPFVVYPATTTIFTLRACATAGNELCSTATVTVQVIAAPTATFTPFFTNTPTRTPTPTPVTPQPPGAPTPISPTGTLSCLAALDVNLSWTRPSGDVAGYVWVIERAYAANGPWEAWASNFTVNTSATRNVVCGSAYYYHWRVAAQDSQGQLGPWSVWVNFRAK